MKIYQAYYADEQKQHLLPNCIPVDTRGWDIPLLEYDIFRRLRPEGDFGVVSWKFKHKTMLDEWEDTAREKLKEYDAVIINPFPAISAISYNCWDTHPVIKKYTSVDIEIPMREMAFCSYILAKQNWWDKYFQFIDSHLQKLTPEASISAGYCRNQSLTAAPFLIERWLNYTLDGAWIWEYDEAHHRKKFNHTVFHKLQNIKFTDEWNRIRNKFHFWQVCSQDDKP